jgi:hypothetical protein
MHGGLSPLVIGVVELEITADIRSTALPLNKPPNNKSSSMNSSRRNQEIELS